MVVSINLAEILNKNMPYFGSKWPWAIQSTDVHVGAQVCFHKGNIVSLTKQASKWASNLSIFLTVSIVVGAAGEVQKK